MTVHRINALQPMDANGLADPFVRVKFIPPISEVAGVKNKTAVKVRGKRSARRLHSHLHEIRSIMTYEARVGEWLLIYSYVAERRRRR